jgi:cell division protein FtsB
MKIKNGVKHLGAVENLEFQIEQQRTKMYQASQEKDNTEKLISISQDLDRLLNKLEKLKNHYRLN